ncbi:SPOR domain-containing protein [Thorsellia anophelis]|uniref:Cell division protein FtsN n=1 Tax=Thorsellia anophelis DSM 18579 TaxID=1123402 RepID=A0A1H9ZXA4_9GAMM|nr:SPOR domain-containing protein [Thorsellia anophelis]SES86402.1 cell division protein FtsN [Thorsellia anophelis DSM 18579]
MAQRDYISNKNRQVRNGNRRNTSEKHYAGKSPVILIALIVLVLAVFIGGLYFIMNNAPSEEVEKQRLPTASDIPPPPEERWQYISSLESNSAPVTNNENTVQNLEQEALNALIAQQLGTNPQDQTAGQGLPQAQDNVNTTTGLALNPNEPVQPINQPEPATLQPIYTEPLEQAPVTDQSGVTAIPQTDTIITDTTPIIPTGTPPVSDTPQTASTPSLADEQAALEKKRALERQKELEYQYQLEQQALFKKQEQDRIKAEEIIKQNKREAERLAQQQNRPQTQQPQQQQQQPQVAVNNRNSQPVTTNAPAAGWQLQCGSFQDSKRADEVKATLAFKGIQARVVPAGNYNRVMIGPFNNRNQASDAQSRAKSAGAPSCIILAP